MGRTATNVIGNSIATTVVARWEGMLGAPREVAGSAGTAAQAQGRG